MTSYEALKVAHVSFVCVSGGLFVFRGGYAIVKDTPMTQRWARILPHVNDTLLLASAVAMLTVASINPFAVDWLTAKVVALPVYIVLGAAAFRANGRRRIALFAAALATFAYIAAVALTRSPTPA